VNAAIYARVSTTDKGQNTEVQLSALRPFCSIRNWEYTEYIDEGVSGAKESRPAFNRLMTDAQQRKIDVIVVWKLDRFSRSLRHLVNTLNDLQSLGIDFVSYSEHLDFTTPTGKLMVNIIAAFAQFERDLMSERIKAGMQHVKSKGKHVGRKPIAPVDIKKVIDDYEKAKESSHPISVRAIAKRTKMTKSTVHTILNLYKQGKIDRDGYSYPNGLFEDPDITTGTVQKGVSLFDSEKQEISGLEGNPS